MHATISYLFIFKAYDNDMWQLLYLIGIIGQTMTHVKILFVHVNVLAIILDT